jgi:3-phenylpropionate/cinnamic acid dioxygenase small subunit
MTESAAGGSTGDRFALYDLFAAYGALIDAAEFDAWLALFAATCTYHVVPRENYERGLPAGLIYCDSRAMLEDRIRALREANKYNIHTDRHLIGVPRLTAKEGDATLVEAPFAVYQTDQEGETRRDRALPRQHRSRGGSPQIPRQAGCARHLCGAEPACHTVISLPELVCVLRRTGCA